MGMQSLAVIIHKSCQCISVPKVLKTLCLVDDVGLHRIESYTVLE